MDRTSPRKNHKGFGKWMIGGMLAVFAAFSCILFSASTSNDSMISRAERLVSWRQVPIPSSVTTNDFMILDHHWTPDGSLLRAPFSLGPNQSVAVQLERLNARTGQTISNQPIALNSIQRSTLEEPCLSPDGKWLFLEDAGDCALVNVETGAVRHLKRGMYGASDYMIIAYTKGSNITTRASSRPGVRRTSGRMSINMMMLADRIAWMPDSKSFLEISDDLAKKQTSLVVRTLDDRPAEAVPLRRFASGFPPKVLGVTEKGDVMVVDKSGYYVGNGYLLVDLKRKTVTSHPFKNIPRDLLVKQIEMSPDRRRLLWKTVNINPDPARLVKLMLDQLVLHKEPQFRVDVKVSDLDGANMREVCGGLLSGKEEDGFQMAHWMPSSNRISFWYKDAIYAVPAE